MEVGFYGNYDGLLLQLSDDKRTGDVKGVNACHHLAAECAQRSKLPNGGGSGEWRC